MSRFLTHDYDLDEEIREAIIGGRCQAFKTGVFEGYFAMVDFVS